MLNDRERRAVELAQRALRVLAEQCECFMKGSGERHQRAAWAIVQAVGGHSAVLSAIALLSNVLDVEGPLGPALPRHITDSASTGAQLHAIETTQQSAKLPFCGWCGNRAVRLTSRGWRCQRCDVEGDPIELPRPVCGSFVLDESRVPLPLCRSCGHREAEHAR